MAVVLPDLTTLDTVLVDEAFDVIAQRIAEFDPTIDTKFGVFQNLVVYINALLVSAVQTEIDSAKRSLSLYTLQQDAAAILEEDDTLTADELEVELDANTELADTAAGNYRITRKTGALASGSITVIVDTLAPLLIPAGSIWSSQGLNYVTDQNYAIRTTSAQVQTDNDRLMTSVGTSRWAFTIGVVAAEQGTIYNLEADTRLTLVSDLGLTPITVYVESAIEGGKTEETTADLANRVLTGIATQAWSNRTNIEALIRAKAAFEDIVNISIVGFGDEEMLRDQHSLWPGSMGGRVDLYVRTQELLATTTETITATLVALDGADGTWRFSIDNDLVPGFYEITKIVPDDNTLITGFVPDTDVRDVNITTTYTPDIVGAAEGAYSPYQTTTIEFVDTATNASALVVDTDTKDYLVTISYLPLLQDIQDYLSDRNRRDPAGDLLVKAPVPCFTSVDITITKASNEDDPDTDAIKKAVGEVVNNIGFTGMIPASLIANTVYPLLTATMGVQLVTLSGRIRRPDGTNFTSISSTMLSVPSDEGTDMVSAKTVQFFTNSDDISVTITPVQAAA